MGCPWRGAPTAVGPYPKNKAMYLIDFGQALGSFRCISAAPPRRTYRGTHTPAYQPAARLGSIYFSEICVPPPFRPRALLHRRRNTTRRRQERRLARMKCRIAATPISITTPAFRARDRRGGIHPSDRLKGGGATVEPS